MFVGLDTGTIESCDSSSRIVDLDAVEYVPDGDDYADDVRVIDLAREHGVPVADLWAAYKREQQRTRELCPVGELAGDPHTYTAGDGIVIPWDVAGDPRTGVEACRGCVSAIDQDYDNAHRCESCGVTGGGVENGSCGDCMQTGDPVADYLRENGYPVLELVDSSRSTVSEQATIDAFAEELRLRASSQTETWEFAHETSERPFLSGYTVGDFALVRVVDDLYHGPIDPPKRMRIVSRSGDAEGRKVTVKFQPEVV